MDDREKAIESLAIWAYGLSNYGTTPWEKARPRTKERFRTAATARLLTDQPTPISVSQLPRPETTRLDRLPEGTPVMIPGVVSRQTTRNNNRTGTNVHLEGVGGNVGWELPGWARVLYYVFQPRLGD